MRTLEELMKEFKSILDNGRLRQNWIDALEVNELKILRDGFEKALPWKGTATWLYYVEELIFKRIEENRNNKLNELGI